MKLTNPVKNEDGVLRSFYTYKIPFGRLCRCIATCPGVEFTARPRVFWSSDDAFADFRYKGHDYRIDMVWADTHVCPKDEKAAYPEIIEIETHVENHGDSLIYRMLRRLFQKQRQ